MCVLEVNLKAVFEKNLSLDRKNQSIIHVLEFW